MLYIKNNGSDTLIASGLLIGCLLLAMPLNLLANSPVKSVDAAGNVTYSDKPVVNAQSVTKVPIQEGPNASEIDAAQQQAQKNINTAEKIDKANADALKKKNALNKKAPSTPRTPTAQPDVIYTGGYRNPIYNNRPRPRPPAHRPGIRPPITIQPIPKTRPRAGRR